MKYEIIDKYYSAEDKLFHIIKKKTNTHNGEYIDETFISFDSFYKATKKDLSNADLLDYGFETENLKKYNFSHAKISSQTMLKLGVYDGKIERVLKKDMDCLSALPMISQDLVPCRNNGEISVMSEEFDKDFIVFIDPDDSSNLIACEYNEETHEVFDIENDEEYDELLEKKKKAA